MDSASHAIKMGNWLQGQSASIVTQLAENATGQHPISAQPVILDYIIIIEYVRSTVQSLGVTPIQRTLIAIVIHSHSIISIAHIYFVIFSMQPTLCHLHRFYYSQLHKLPKWLLSAEFYLCLQLSSKYLCKQSNSKI